MGAGRGVTYLYSAELWAPFIWIAAAGEASRVNIAYMKWVTGLGGALLERCRGWTPIRNLDDKAFVPAMRIFEDARQFQGLVGRVVRQLLRGERVNLLQGELNSSCVVELGRRASLGGLHCCRFSVWWNAERGRGSESSLPARNKDFTLSASLSRRVEECQSLEYTSRQISSNCEFYTILLSAECSR